MSSVLFVMALLTSAANGLAADVTGKWKGPMEGTGADVVLDLKTDGGSVTGTMSDSEGKPRPIAKGSLDGDKISLTVASEYQGNPITLLVTGTVSGDTMNLKIQTEDGAWGTDAVVKRGS
ncbi:MAG: hypothetical protein ABSG65_31630 [Bryobacteraceae bacterium]